MRIALAVLLGLAACLPSQPFVCADATQCVRAGVVGTCESTGFCAFPDSTCDSEWRYGEASSELENACVGGIDSATLVPSNDVDPALGAEVSSMITIDSAVTLDTDTGEISGGLTRAAGEGVAAAIGYHHTMSGSTPLGVFVFAQLDVASTGTIQFSGSRAVVLLIAHDATIDGVIDGSGDCGGMRSCAGPGGGSGRTASSGATGCGAGGDGISGTQNTDGGGGGGGAGVAGAHGGNANAATGGAAGPACLAAKLVPLGGGGGGGAGGMGIATEPALGGGGGGAIQITSLGHLAVNGTIDVGGAGGGGGPLSPTATNAGAGSGGGAGGGLLLEALTIVLGGNTVLVANGGGGGGGGFGSEAGNPGENASRSANPAAGGVSLGNNNGPGGKGGAGTMDATVAPDELGNGGGGGGGVGVIDLLGVAPITLTGTISPPAMTGMATTR